MFSVLFSIGTDGGLINVCIRIGIDNFETGR
jgi:hypothetical protein